MTEVITSLGLTIQNKDSQKGDTFIKADVSVKVDDTKPLEEQLAWAKLVAARTWETPSDLLEERLTAEQLTNSQEKSDLAIKALRNHQSRLLALEAKINTIKK